MYYNHSQFCLYCGWPSIASESTASSQQADDSTQHVCVCTRTYDTSQIMTTSWAGGPATLPLPPSVGGYVQCRVEVILEKYWGKSADDVCCLLAVVGWGSHSSLLVIQSALNFHCALFAQYFISIYSCARVLCMMHCIVEAKTTFFMGLCVFANLKLKRASGTPFSGCCVLGKH